MYDFLVVGAGLTGATFAQQAKEKGHSVCVIDQRSHIAGNCYSEQREGIEVHTYGPHVFHTDDQATWNYINRFTKFNHFVCRPKVISGDRIFSFPINMMTLYQLWGVKTPEEARQKLEDVRVPCSNPRNMEEWALSQVGRELYETFVYGYTTKQWKRTPDRLPSSILRRIPIRLTWDDNYFNDRFQGIPIGGYTQMVASMLEGISVYLSSDMFAEKSLWEKLAKKIIYTGPIDKLYNYAYGELEYRTLRFEHRVEQGDVQGTATVNYADLSVPWTRQVEHKHFEFHETTKTIVTREFPEEWTGNEVPYYPINDDTNGLVYQKYKAIADADQKYIVAGRLGRYTYTDMGPAISSAIALAKKHL